MSDGEIALVAAVLFILVSAVVIIVHDVHHEERAKRKARDLILKGSEPRKRKGKP